MIESLKQDGFVYAPWKMKFSEVGEFYNHLNLCQVFNAHVQAKSDKTSFCRDARRIKDWPIFSFSMQDVITAPYFFEYALRGFDVAKKYFEEFPRLYSINAFCTQPGSYEYRDTHSWHRDGDDRKQLAMFMYGTNVHTIEDGPQLYQRGSHLNCDSDFSYSGQTLPPETVKTVAGSAGTIFFNDPRGYHMGIRPSKFRMLVWARWGVSNPPEAYVWDNNRPVSKDLLGDRYPNDPELQEAIKLVVV